MNWESFTSFPNCSSGDDSSSSFQGLVGGFQNLDHPQTCRPIIDWCSVVQYAVDEIFKLDFQGLSLLDFWRANISRAIADQQIIDASPISHLHAFIVDFDFFIGLKIIPHQHLFLATDQSLANLDRCKPVDVDVRA